MRVTNVLFTAGWMCAVANSIVFFVSYFLMKLKIVMIWKALIYLPAIVGVSIFFSGLTREMSKLWQFHHGEMENLILFCSFGIFFALNYTAWRALFKVEVRPAIILSLFIAFINVATYVIATPIYK
jgi:succinate-acetate transporter protein